jgi:hypothetical protein
VGLALAGVLAGVVWSVATSSDGTDGQDSRAGATPSDNDDTGGDRTTQQSDTSNPGDGDAGGTDAGDVAELPEGTTWILVLHSTEKSQDVEEALAWAEDLGRGDPRVVVVDSDSYPTLQPGFWVVAVPGYASEQAARDDCLASFDLPVGEDCYPRLVG